MTTDDYIAYSIDDTPTAEDRIRWAKATDDCEKAVNKMAETATKVGKNLRDEVRKAVESQFKNDTVNHPSHYTDGKIEVIDFIEDKKLGYHLGNVVKYVSRAGKKCPDKEIEDLKKARWYLNRHIERLESANEKEV